MHANKPIPGAKFPSISVPKLGGGTLTLGVARDGFDWQMIVVYRGRHCPICTRYLREANEVVAPLAELGIEVVAVSADSEDRAQEQIDEVKPDFDVGYGLTEDQMKSLGLYVSGPRHGMDVEGPFAEPGLFIVNERQQLWMADVSNVPFLRPQLNSVVGGLRFVRGFLKDQPRTFPANGTFA
ncbi:redoxin domain-containing protein [Tateyamaria omphalii]|uniref:redoxin domain-containing protein n=1 Tax=Tateyamaria omphalii TaxID=299262 RepID=UPI001C99D458|nr:redoxin domain-containing protein [Tateyamaria omphalii]MBY5933513.1 redoxin domain-containing protein [Tateyamaria omphalii]